MEHKEEKLNPLFASVRFMDVVDDYIDIRPLVRPNREDSIVMLSHEEDAGDVNIQLDVDTAEKFAHEILNQIQLLKRRHMLNMKMP
jgi:hypothetical protein